MPVKAGGQDSVSMQKEQILAIAAKYGAYNVRVFGSVAQGTADESSDVDFLVIAESNLPRFKRSRELYKLFKPFSFFPIHNGII